MTPARKFRKHGPPSTHSLGIRGRKCLQTHFSGCLSQEFPGINSPEPSTAYFARILHGRPAFRESSHAGGAA